LVTDGAQMARWVRSTHGGIVGMASPCSPAGDDSDALVYRGTQ
jgi:hypothetical protein